MADVNQIARVLTTAPVIHLGISALPLNPSASPVCAMITDPEGGSRTMAAYLYAMDAAKRYWPAAAALAIVGGNHLMTDATKDPLPSEFHRLMSAETLLQLTGETPT